LLFFEADTVVVRDLKFLWESCIWFYEWM